MNMRFIQTLTLIFISVAATAQTEKPPLADGYEKANQSLPYMKIKNTYFTEITIGGVKYRRLAIVMDNNFRPCEDTSPSGTLQPWIEVREEDSGEAVFDMFSSVALASILSDKRVNMVIDDTLCYGSTYRAKLNSINIAKD